MNLKLSRLNGVIVLGLILVGVSFQNCAGGGGGSSPAAPATDTTKSSANCTNGKNILRSSFSGGTAKVVEIASTANVYNNDLTLGCGSSWNPQGSLCDAPGFEDSKTSSSKTDGTSNYNRFAITTWYNQNTNATPKVGYGVGTMVVDIGSAKDLNEFRVFQVFQDGKITHIRIFTHAETGNLPPLSTGPGWVEVVTKTNINAGAVDSSGNYINPTVLTLASTVNTRYLKVLAYNDNSLDPASWEYIEIGTLKAFCN